MGDVDHRFRIQRARLTNWRNGRSSSIPIIKPTPRKRFDRTCCDLRTERLCQNPHGIVGLVGAHCPAKPSVSITSNVVNPAHIASGFRQMSCRAHRHETRPSPDQRSTRANRHARASKPLPASSPSGFTPRFGGKPLAGAADAGLHFVQHHSY